MWFSGMAFTQRVFGLDHGGLLPDGSAAEATGPTLAQYPQKTKLILLTDRPPQLETPLHYFRSDLTPNDAFFVRWHLAGIPTSVDLKTFRLKVTGHVKKPLSLSVSELRSKFEPVELVALCQCSGNSRSLFEPRVPGGQWGNGAMGNARWKGVRLKDVLDAAEVQPGAVQVGVHGLDEPVLPATPSFQKSLEIDHARDGEVMIAYEMNDAEIPLLNGFPLRLIVPGWYATYWVKSFSNIAVLDQPLKSFWMDKAYRIPDNADANESPHELDPKTVPINVMAVHSIFVTPHPGQQLRAGQPAHLSGVATDGGSGIHSVEVSTDGGSTWKAAELGTDLGKYSWRQWKMDWTPEAKGKFRLMVKATNDKGETQLTSQWNHSGYQRSVIEHLDVVVV